MAEDQNPNTAPQESAQEQTPAEKPKAGGAKKPTVLIPVLVVVIFLIGFGYMFLAGDRAEAPLDTEEDAAVEEEASEESLDDLEEELELMEEEAEEMDDEIDEMEEEIEDMEEELDA